MLEVATRETSSTLSAADAVRELIIEGELRAGDRFTQGRVAARLGVSRAPLRMALERLAHQGMLESTPGGSFVVRSFSLQDVDDALYLRAQLEGAAARLAAQRQTGREPMRDLSRRVADLGRVVRDAKRDPDASLGRYAGLNDAFHAVLFVLADSHALRAAYEALIALPFAGPSALIPYQSVRPMLSAPLGLAHAQHLKILRAIRIGDGDAAESLARNHAELARYDLRAVLRRGVAISTLPGSGLISPLTP